MRLAVLQMRASAARRRNNVARIEAAARQAAGAGAQLFVVPELAVSGYGAGRAIIDGAERADGPLAQRLAALARDLRMGLVVGFAERDGEIVWNSALVAQPDGTVGVYRKSNLYGAYERSMFEAAAPATLIVEIAGLKVGFLICYDVEFPENVRRLARADAQLVVVPTALPSSDHAETIARMMIPVRAFENQIFVAYADHCGEDSLVRYAGLSCIAAPDGSLLASAGATDEELLVADILPQDYAASASENSYLADLRE
jgi:predicted amidohydrolase